MNFKLPIYLFFVLLVVVSFLSITTTNEFGGAQEPLLDFFLMYKPKFTYRVDLYISFIYFFSILIFGLLFFSIFFQKKIILLVLVMMLFSMWVFIYTTIGAFMDSNIFLNSSMPFLVLVIHSFVALLKVIYSAICKYIGR